MINLHLTPWCCHRHTPRSILGLQNQLLHGFRVEDLQIANIARPKQILAVATRPQTQAPNCSKPSAALFVPSRTPQSHRHVSKSPRSICCRRCRRALGKKITDWPSPTLVVSPLGLIDRDLTSMNAKKSENSPNKSGLFNKEASAYRDGSSQ